MIVNFKQKFSIIHIPKTGGTSIKKSLNPRFLGNEIFFFHKKLFVYPKFKQRSLDIKEKLKYSHLTLAELTLFYGDIFSEIKNFEFYVTIRDPKKRFYSSLAQYFGEKKIDLSNLEENILEKLIKNILNDLKNDNFKKDISLTSFRKQIDYIYLGNIKLVKNIYDINDTQKLIDDVNKKHGKYFDKLSINNQRQDIIYNPLVYFVSKFFPTSFKVKAINFIIHLYRTKKKFTTKYKNVLFTNQINDFINDYYKEDIKLYKNY